MKYPEEVLTKTKKGKIEARQLIDRGRFVRYEYIDPESGKKSENKVKLVLISESNEEEFFVIPVKDGRYLMLPTESKGERKIWDNVEKKVVDL
jgi:hypothetical protein